MECKCTVTTRKRSAGGGLPHPAQGQVCWQLWMHDLGRSLSLPSVRLTAPIGGPGIGVLHEIFHLIPASLEKTDPASSRGPPTYLQRAGVWPQHPEFVG